MHVIVKERSDLAPLWRGKSLYEFAAFYREIATASPRDDTEI